MLWLQFTITVIAIVLLNLHYFSCFVPFPGNYAFIFSCVIGMFKDRVLKGDNFILNQRIVFYYFIESFKGMNRMI